MPVARGPSRQHYTIIQALRGLAALWVVLFHAEEGRHLPTLVASLPVWLATVVFRSGDLGVAMFFGLSGFVIAHSLHDFSPNAGNLGRFFLKRSIRLDPAYWASLVIAVVVAMVSARFKGQTPVIPSAGLILAHMFYLQELLHLPEINYVYWTLTYEIQFYLFYAAMKFVPRGIWICLVLAILSAAGLFSHLLEGLFLDLWGAFFVGALARHAVDEPKWLAGIVVLGALVCTSAFGAISAATAIFLWLSVYLGWAQQGLNWRWLQFLGAISYSLYLIHNPVVSVVSFLIHRLLGAGLGPDIICLAVVIVGSLLAATCLWLLVERPSHRLSSRVRATKPGSNGSKHRLTITPRITTPVGE